MKRILNGVALWIMSLCVVTLVVADDQEAGSATKETETEIAEGHSVHGEAFNEGPRQAAWLMEGTGRVRFDVTTASDAARNFVVQGIGQLHGFWYFEAERSFRQAATLDPDCAIAYWGMAMANRRNSERAKGFIEKAVEKKDKASRREQLLIEALNTYLNAKAGSTDEKKRRARKYVSDLESLLFEFPDEIETKAFLCEFLWSAKREGLDIVSYLAVDALIQEVLDEEPLHPAHHYRIHLWDTKRPQNALESAALCGPSAPAIAHMWHMPGHIYSRLKRYHDAVYQQEASARVDHAYMMKNHVLPDQIHNFAHNNEWCIRNLVHIGRVRDAISLAKNMIELPRHPKYNHIGRSGSYKYGRQRLLDVLRTYQLHEQIIKLSQSPYLEDTGDQSEDLKRDRYVASACAATGNLDDAQKIRTRLAEALADEKTKQQKAGDQAEEKANAEKKNDRDVRKARSVAEAKFRGRIRDIERALQEIDGRVAVAEGRFADALELLNKAGGVPVEEITVLMLKADRKDDAIRRIADHVRTNPQEVRPLAAQVEILWAAEKKEEARKAFEVLRKISADIDLTVPVFRRLTAIAEELGIGRDWVIAYSAPADIGARPALDALGPFRWQPVRASDWKLKDVDNKDRRLAEFRGRPLIVIFYLGYGCLHCAEQLQKFAPKTEEFRKAGFEIVAISTDDQDSLYKAYDALDEKFTFPLLSDEKMDVFRRYRCFDDFENQPLHGTFIIDGQGRIRWQDISYEPFMDPDFVLKEGIRLLGQDQLTDEATQDTDATAAE